MLAAPFVQDGAQAHLIEGIFRTKATHGKEGSLGQLARTIHHID
jgi:hypothetical protein